MRYIDIQYVYRGIDTMGWKNIDNCINSINDFNIIDDYILFNDMPHAVINIEKNYFAIFFPSDSHLPLMNEAEMLKVVVKVEL